MKIDLKPYVLNNFKANSCYVTLIVNTYYLAFEKRKKGGKRMYQELTFDYFCSLIGIENKKQSLGLSIRNSIPFFEKFKLGLDVINVYEEILFSYRPEKLNTKIFPQVLRILVRNNHL